MPRVQTNRVRVAPPPAPPASHHEGGGGGAGRSWDEYDQLEPRVLGLHESENTFTRPTAARHDKVCAKVLPLPTFAIPHTRCGQPASSQHSHARRPCAACCFGVAEV
jgi:hypothetical protein